jgi:hypothetical protein
MLIGGFGAGRLGMISLTGPEGWFLPGGTGGGARGFSKLPALIDYRLEDCCDSHSNKDEGICDLKQRHRKRKREREAKRIK